MALFNGVDLFGSVCTVATVWNPKRRQVTKYPGVNGMVWKDLGDNGGQSTVTGLIYASNSFLLATIEATINAIQLAGNAGVFVDNYGNSISNTILDVFEPAERIMVLAGGQGVCRSFRCTFIHMN